MKTIILIIFLSFFSILYANNSCIIPSNIKNLVIKSGLKNLQSYPDIKRNYQNLKGLCIHLIKFKEAPFVWKIFLITNPKKTKGAFWFLPHDNENSAFSAAVYATKKYGGGFLAIFNNDKRYNLNQDPNRNFANTSYRICKEQIAPSPIYTNLIFSIINFYKPLNYPYLALHNNTNRGGISILKDSIKTKSFLAYPIYEIKKGVGLADEDSIIYIAGSTPAAPIRKVKTLLNSKLNVKYEYVTAKNNDCSMSNYVVLGLKSANYYNIETQHSKTITQKKMIDKLIYLIQRSQL